MKESKLEDSRGRLTAFGFSCGYMERVGSLKLFREHEHYHLRGFLEDGRRVMECFDTLTEARKYRAKIRKEAKK